MERRETFERLSIGPLVSGEVHTEGGDDETGLDRTNRRNVGAVRLVE
jgi:hypothetical protein